LMSEGVFREGAVRLTYEPLSNNILKISACREGREESLRRLKELLKLIPVTTAVSTQQRVKAWDVRIKEVILKISWEGKALAELSITSPKEGMIVLEHYVGDSHIYGLGEKYGPLDRRGRVYRLWNVDQPIHLPLGEPMYASIPFYLALKPGKYLGVFMNHAGYAEVDAGAGSPGVVRTSIYGDALVAYVIAGRNPLEVIEAYTSLTGRPYLPPKWALGYHQSRYSYMNSEEVLNVARAFREKGIPCDAIHLDIDYMEGYRIFTWSSRGFGKPERLAKELRKLGIRLVTILDVGVKEERGYKVFEEGMAINAFMKTPNGELFRGGVWPGVCVFPDFLRKEVREWWGELVARELLSKGVSGVWLDMNEPAIFYKVSDAESVARRAGTLLSEGRIRELGDLLRKAPALISTYGWPWLGVPRVDAVHEASSGLRVHHDNVHNAYPLLEAEATLRAFKKHSPENRWFILSRAAYAGIQKYAAVWSGDNQSCWEHLSVSIPMLLNMSLSGLHFVGADVGGFEGDTEPELLLRWTQLGAFYPFFRNHSSKGTRRQEPWAFGPEWEKLIADAIKLRYRFLPYIYSVFVEASRSGKPVMRALFLEFPEDERSYTVSDEFMVGKSLLVAPVTAPGKEARAVYLPAVRWVNYWTGEVLEPGWKLVNAPLDKIPLFIREDTAVITTDPKQTAHEVWDPLYVESFVNHEAEAIIYDDDGESLNGKYFELAVTIRKCGDRLKISTEPKSSRYSPEINDVVFKVFSSGAIREVSLNGVRVDAKVKDGVLHFTIPLNMLRRA